MEGRLLNLQEQLLSTGFTYQEERKEATAVACCSVFS
jgi:hypothetical protein